MRFLTAPGSASWERARPPVRWFLVFALVLVVALTVQRGAAGGLDPARVETHYLGPGHAEPLPVVALWEEVHVNAFVYGFLLLVLGSLNAVSPLAPWTRRLLLIGGAAFALSDLFAPFVVVAASGLGWIRVVTFSATSVLLATGIVVAFVRFGRAGRRDA